MTEKVRFGPGESTSAFATEDGIGLGREVRLVPESDVAHATGRQIIVESGDRQIVHVPSAPKGAAMASWNGQPGAPTTCLGYQNGETSGEHSLVHIVN